VRVLNLELPLYSGVGPRNAIHCRVTSLTAAEPPAAPQTNAGPTDDGPSVRVLWGFASLIRSIPVQKYAPTPSGAGRAGRGFSHGWGFRFLRSSSYPLCSSDDLLLCSSDGLLI
jgi:hypothetical protein